MTMGDMHAAAMHLRTGLSALQALQPTRGRKGSSKGSATPSAVPAYMSQHFLSLYVAWQCDKNMLPAPNTTSEVPESLVCENR